MAPRSRIRPKKKGARRQNLKIIFFNLSKPIDCCTQNTQKTLFENILVFRHESPCTELNKTESNRITDAFMRLNCTILGPGAKFPNLSEEKTNDESRTGYVRIFTKWNGPRASSCSGAPTADFLTRKEILA